MNDIYATVDEEFYLHSLQSPNPFTRYYHRTRYEYLVEQTRRLYRPGARILDVGCGSCEWNIHHLPVVGLDKSAKLLERAKKEKTLSEGVCVDFTKTLPFESSSFDFVILSEVLEHLDSPCTKLQEICRVTKPGSHLLLTVPYDAPFSLWHLLFPLQCAYMGWIRNNPYYRASCGHINHFSPNSLRALLGQTGFEVERAQTWLSLNIAMLARKAKDK